MRRIVPRLQHGVRVQETAEQLDDLGFQVLLQVGLYHTGNNLGLFLKGIGGVCMNAKEVWQCD